jgi:hypothetical protein
MVTIALGVPGPFEIVLLLLFLGIPIAIVLLVIRGVGKGRRPIAPAFPVEPVDGPGRYRVAGVDKNTRADRELIVEADSRANAHVKAELDGIIVTRIDKI